MKEEKQERATEDRSTRQTESQVGTAAEELCATIARLQRLQAEFENYKKRVSRDLEDLTERVTDQVLVGLLAPYENLERALLNYAEDRDVDALAEGLGQIIAQFAQTLEQRGVERIPCVGEPFDPALHEALLCVPSDEARNTVIEEFSPGYRRDGRVLRASRVSVSQGPETREETS